MRSRSVGRASCVRGRSSASRRRSFGATGLDSSTSGLRSSSVARRLTNVVFARRMNGGRRLIARARSSLRAPIAPNVRLRLVTSPARSSRLTARSVTSFDDETMKRSSIGVSRLSSENSRLDAASEGLRYSQPRLARAPWPSYWSANPWMTPLSALRVR